MWNFRGFAAFRSGPCVPGSSCDLCKYEEKISGFIRGGGGYSVASLTQSNEVQLYFWSSRWLSDWRKPWLQLKCHNLTQRFCLQPQEVLIAIKSIWGFLTYWGTLLKFSINIQLELHQLTLKANLRKWHKPIKWQLPQIRKTRICIASKTSAGSAPGYNMCSRCIGSGGCWY